MPSGKNRPDSCRGPRPAGADLDADSGAGMPQLPGLGGAGDGAGNEYLRHHSGCRGPRPVTPLATGARPKVRRTAGARSEARAPARG